MTYSIDKRARLVRIVGEGRLSDDDMVRCIAALRGDPDLEADMHTLSDMRDIEVGFASEGIERMFDVMQRTAERRGDAKAAIVVSSEVAFGMARMVELRAEDRSEPRFRVFRDLDAARRWLGIA